jgi:hypothetical protein
VANFIALAAPGNPAGRLQAPLSLRFRPDLIGGRYVILCDDGRGLGMRRNLLKQLSRDEEANFSIFAAIAMVPLVLAVGVAIDFSSISNRRSELQNALDSAVLAVAREGDTISDSEAIDIARSFLVANFRIGHGDLNVIRTGTRVTVEATARQDLNFAGVLGYEDWSLSASSSADIAFNRYEIALVLDTTDRWREAS